MECGGAATPLWERAERGGPRIASERAHAAIPAAASGPSAKRCRRATALHSDACRVGAKCNYPTCAVASASQTSSSAILRRRHDAGRPSPERMAKSLEVETHRLDWWLGFFPNLGRIEIDSAFEQFCSVLRFSRFIDALGLQCSRLRLHISIETLRSMGRINVVTVGNLWELMFALSEWAWKGFAR